MEMFQDFVDKLPDFFKPWGEEILLRYFDFDGRTDRGTFWKVFLINLIISAVFSGLAAIPILGVIFGIVAGLYGVATIIPGIALQIRRLRDVGKEWYCIFLALIPCVGGIIILIFDLQESV